MNNLFTFIIGVYVLICPFYLFESGVPQPAHYVAGIAFIMMAFSKDFRSILKDKIVLYLFLFVLLTFVINLGYYFKYNTEDGGVEFQFSFLSFISENDTAKTCNIKYGHHFLILCYFIRNTGSSRHFGCR